jgi:hypothetical protein
MRAPTLDPPVTTQTGDVTSLVALVQRRTSPSTR